MTNYTSMTGPDMLAACGVDAAKWAAAFNQTAVHLGYSSMDEGWLIGWFANAIMAMHDKLMLGGEPMNGDHAQYLIDQRDKDNTP